MHRSQLHRSAIVLVGTLVVAASLALPQPASAQRRSAMLVSGTSDRWTAPDGGLHAAALTYGHIGCENLDDAGYCTGGVWPRIAAGRWIWKSQMASAEDATVGTTVSFVKIIDLVAPAPLSIEISADNEYYVYWNDEFIGTDYGWEEAEEWALDDRAGRNDLRIIVRNDQGSDPVSNPAGVVYQIHPRFELQHDFSLFPPNPGQDNSQCWNVANRHALCREVRGIEEVGHHQTYWIRPGAVLEVTASGSRYGYVVGKKRSGHLYEGCVSVDPKDGYYCDYKAVGTAGYKTRSGARFWLEVLRNWSDYTGRRLLECATAVMTAWAPSDGSGQPLAEVVEACNKKPFTVDE